MSTTTGKTRTNRPDVRPNEKLRRKISRKMEDEKTIQDLRVTKKKREDRVEREVPRLPLRAAEPKDKVMRAIMKKLKQIDELIKRQKAGEELDAQQLKKVDTLDAVLQQMDEYTKEQGQPDVDA